MFLSVFDLFKVGVGPSSSHTMGPMLAAARFLDALRDGADRVPGSGAPARLEATLHGSLAFTGKGHATDRAVILGLLGFLGVEGVGNEAERRLAALAETGTIDVPGIGPLGFDPAKGVVFDYGPPLAGHANGMVLKAFDASGNLHLTETYYSIGGGFVLTERQMRTEAMKGDDAQVDRPHPFATAAEMLAMGDASGLSIAAMKRANETAGGHATLDAGLDRLWSMQASITRQSRSRPLSRGAWPPAASLARFIAAMERPEASPMASISAAVAKGQGRLTLASSPFRASVRSWRSVRTKPPPIE